MTKKVNEIEILDPEFGADFRYKTQEERDFASNELMEARRERYKKVTKEQIKTGMLMRLLHRMEGFNQTEEELNQKRLSDYLAAYIDIIYPKRSMFAEAIEVTPAHLSQVINDHRDPTDEFMKKLMIHSEIAFVGVNGFNSKIWYEVYFRGKMNKLIGENENWREEIEKHVHYKGEAYVEKPDFPILSR
jgi:hypothetical protein